jgi:hypothetical protein
MPPPVAQADGGLPEGCGELLPLMDYVRCGERMSRMEEVEIHSASSLCRSRRNSEEALCLSGSTIAQIGWIDPQLLAQLVRAGEMIDAPH